MDLSTPYSIIKRYPLPYGKPWYPSHHHGYTRGHYCIGCGHEPEIGPITQAQQWMREANAANEVMLGVYRKADTDWPWIDSTPKQLDLFASAT